MALIRAFSCHASDGGLGNDHGVAEGERQQDINEEENSSAVFCCEVGKTPDISKSDGSACCSQHVTDFAGKRAAGFVVFVHRVPSFCVLQKFWVYGQFLKTFYADIIKKIVTLLGRKVTTKFFIFFCPAGIPRPVPPSAPAQWSCDRDAMRFPRRKEERCRYRHRQRGPGLW